MALDKILSETFKPEEKIVLPKDLPYNENAQFPRVTERGRRELQNYAGRKGRKAVIFRTINDLNFRINSGSITVSDALRELRGPAEKGDWSAGYFNQKLQELFNEGLVEGEHWPLQFSIKPEDYRKIIERVGGTYTTLKSLSTLFGEPKEKIRKLGGELAKRHVLRALPGAVEAFFYGYREMSRKSPDAPDQIDYFKTPIDPKPVLFLDSKGEETEEAFLPQHMRGEGVEIADKAYMERTILKNLEQIEKGKLEIAGRKMKPTISGLIGPIVVEGGIKRVKNLTLDYIPNLQMLSLIDYDFGSFSKREQEEIDKKHWNKKRFDTFSKENVRRSFDDKRRGDFHNRVFKRHEEKLRSAIQRAKGVFPSFNPPEIDNSEENTNRSAYLHFLAYCTKFASSYTKNEKGLLGIVQPELDKIGLFSLTEKGREVLDDTSPVLPYVELAYCSFGAPTKPLDFKVAKEDL